MVVFRRFGASYEVVDTAPASANALHVSGNKLYAACTGKVQVYTIDDNGKLHLDQSLTVEGNLLTDLATNGGYLYVVTRESLFTFKDGQLVATETDKLDRGHFKPQDRGLRLASALVVDGDKLYIAGWGGSLSVWEIKEGKPVFIKCLRDDRGAEGIEYAKDIVIGDGRLWVIGQRDESLAWFEWKEDDLVCGGSIEVGPFDSLASHDKFLFLGGHEKLKILRTEPFRNSIPRPE